jgi:ubiquitin-protein ligase
MIFHFEIYIMAKFPHTAPHIRLVGISGSTANGQIGFLKNVNRNTQEVKLKFLEAEDWSACIDLIGIALAISIEIENESSQCSLSLNKVSNA